ncbi:MAG: histidine ammonia-lyase [Adhaeribacter sp.]|nr:histidine ammonia-lyase [Adhaeribacter sp.]
MAYILSGALLNLENLEKIFHEKPLIAFEPDFLEKTTATNSQAKPTNTAAAEAFLAAHALAFGPAVPEDVTRLALVLQLYTFLQIGNQPCRAEYLQRILAFHNREVWPIVSEQALPISQLAQLCLPLLGQGKVSFQGYELKAADVLDIFSWEPLSLSAPEVNSFIEQNSFTYAYLVYHLFQLQPLVNWLPYLMQVFDQISENPSEPQPLVWTHLTESLHLTRQQIQNNYTTPFEKQNLAQVRESVQDLLQALTKVMAGIADLTAETFENLTATSEPPVTTSFNLASELVLSLQKQLKLTLANPTDSIILNKDIRILHHEFAEVLRLMEQIIALAFWSVTQVGKVFTLTTGNLTLSTYYHSSFFVPKETVSDQLEKTIGFIRINSPAPLT